MTFVNLYVNWIWSSIFIPVSSRNAVSWLRIFCPSLIWESTNCCGTVYTWHGFFGLTISHRIVHGIFIEQWWWRSSEVIWYLLINSIGCSEIQRSSGGPFAVIICFHVWHRWSREVWYQVFTITHYSGWSWFLGKALSSSSSWVLARWLARSVSLWLSLHWLW